MCVCIGRFAVLSEKYEDLIGSELYIHTLVYSPLTHFFLSLLLVCLMSWLGCLDSAKQGLADLALLQQNTPHPKLNSLISTVNEWMASRTNSEEKVFRFSSLWFIISILVYDLARLWWLLEMISQQFLTIYLTS